jgi:hypothetical protein
MADPQSRKQEDAETGGQTVCLISYLEADNERLRQAAAELSLENEALRQELKKREGDD